MTQVYLLIAGSSNGFVYEDEVKGIAANEEYAKQWALNFITKIKEEHCTGKPWQEKEANQPIKPCNCYDGAVGFEWYLYTITYKAVPLIEDLQFNANQSSRSGKNE